MFRLGIKATRYINLYINHTHDNNRICARAFHNDATTAKSPLWWIPAGTKGGKTKARIIIILKERSMNANQLVESLKLEYNTIRYHLNLLLANGFPVTLEKK